MVQLWLFLRLLLALSNILLLAYTAALYKQRKKSSLNSPTICITPCDKDSNSPEALANLRKSYFSFSNISYPSWESAEIRYCASAENLASTSADLQHNDLFLNSQTRSRLDSFKSLLSNMSPKNLRRRKKSMQMQSTLTLNTMAKMGDCPAVSPKAGRRRKFSLQLDKIILDKNKAMTPEIDADMPQAPPKFLTEKRHSLDGLLDETPFAEQQTKRHGIFSSMMNLLHLPKSDAPRPNRTTPFSYTPLNKRQRSLLSLSPPSDLEFDSHDGPRKRSNTNPKSASMWSLVSSKQSRKPLVIIDTMLHISFMSVELAWDLHCNQVTDIEVQRLDLSDTGSTTDGVAGRLKHAESNDFIAQPPFSKYHGSGGHARQSSDDSYFTDTTTIHSDTDIVSPPHTRKMDDQSMLSRIEKLFPHDDLELVSSSKKARRRRSAPTQIILKNFRKSIPAAVGDNSRLSDNQELVARKFIFESPVQLNTGLQIQERYLFLFNDILFIAKQRSATSYKLKNRILISDMWISDNVSEVCETSQPDPNTSFVIGWPTTNYVASFSSKELCNRWRQKLRRQIDEELSKEKPTVAIEVVYKNVEQERITQLFEIDQELKASNLLRIALEHFEVQGEQLETEYQVWVLSTRDNTYYPLFGHEQPFAIQLSHERDAEDADPNIKCQFILREAKKQLKLERKNQKSKKSRKLTNIFRRSSGKLATSPRSNSVADGKLFGHALDDICDPGLPKPLKELLENLYNSGPYTSGIFRRSSNAKKCLEMANAMNSPDPEGWHEGSVNGLLFASILKKFLNEIPGYLCCSRLFTSWTDALTPATKEEVISQLKSVTDSLPKGNQLLLKYIICILHHISERSDSNKMTSANLAICLGPSLLWCELTESADMEAASKMVPNVIQALLDNCQQIFGDDVVDTFGHPPIAPAESDIDEAEPSTRIQTSYNNSLESLSDNDATVMNSLTQMSPSSCSRDSGLILSDPHEDVAEHSDDHSLRQQLVKSKSYDSLSQSDPISLHGALVPLQTQVSSDSLDCDDEYIELGPPRNYLLTKSSSGAHLSYDKNVELNQPSATRLKDKLALISNRYTGSSTSPLPPREIGYSSSDSDKSDRKREQKNDNLDLWAAASTNSIQKSSTNSSLQRASSSSDDALNAFDNVTYRVIDCPRYLETTDDDHQPTDYLGQFKTRMQNENTGKKQLQDIIQKRITPTPHYNTNDSDSDVQPLASSKHAVKSGEQSRQPKRNVASRKESPRVNRTNTYAGRSDRRHTANVPIVANMTGNLAEMKPIMPEQYRRSRPPPYNEACERNGLFKSGVSEIERIKQTINSAKAKQLYASSVQQYEQEKRTTPTETKPISIKQSESNTTNANDSANQNNNTIGTVVKASNKTKRASTPKSTDSMFYQPPGSTSSCSSKTSSSGSALASSFYRPSQPPPYKQAIHTRAVTPGMKVVGVMPTPDLIDSLDGESLV